MEKKKAVGVIIIGIFLILLSILYISVGLKHRIANASSYLIRYPTFILMLWPVVSLATGVGLLFYKQWAHLLMLLICICKILAEIWEIYGLVTHVGFMAQYFQNYLACLIVIVPFVLIIFYLNLPNVKAQFK